MRSAGELETQARDLLVGWLSGQAESSYPEPGGADVIVRDGPLTIVVEVKRLAEPGWLRGAIEQVREAARRVGSTAVPAIAVPFMAEGGRRLCEEANISWFDLSGNAHIVASGLRIHIEGKPNIFKRPGRPSTVFAPKSSRIVRAMLLEPQSSISQRELARRTGLDEGFTSRVVRKLESDQMVERDAEGAVRLLNPDDVLDGWRQSYDFSKHRTIAGHATARSGDELLATVGAALNATKLDYAATGLAGAWLLTKFAAFRLVTIFVPEEPSAHVLKSIGFRREERGANLWFTVPNDEGVFTGTTAVDDVQCVHPVQAYLDLKSQPERSMEASEGLRNRRLQWGRR
jgi:Transcriptional regulator, AbiEi antitoxin, Type IV TA system